MTRRFLIQVVSCKIALILAGGVLVSAGCSSARTGEKIAQAPVEPAPPPPPPEPSLRAAGDAQLTLFGEFPDKARVPFHAKAASPMEQHTFGTEGADFDVDVSPDGQLLVFSSTRHSMRPDIYLKKVNGQAVTLLASDPASDVQPCFSPDGKRVAFSSSRSGNWDLWMVSLDGGPVRQITHSPMHEVHPSFSPDGKRLVYCVFNPRGEQWEMWVLQVDQPASAKMIGTGLFPRWSPVGESIVYQRARERGGRWFSIWRIDLEAGEPKFPVELAASSDMALIQPTWSPDGQWIAYGTALLSQGSDMPDGIATVMSRGDVWVMRADGASPMQLTDGAGTHFSPAFGADGRVFFTSLRNGAESIWSVKPLLVPITPAPAAAKEPTGGGPAKDETPDAVSMGPSKGR